MLAKRNLIVCSLVILALPFIFSMGGCSGEQLRKQADIASTAANKIESLLVEYDAGRIEDSDLAAAIVASLPAGVQAAAQNALETAGDIRVVATEIKDDLNIFSAEQLEQASKDASNTENFIASSLSVLGLILGGSTTIGGFIMGLRKGMGKGAGMVAQSITAGAKADPVVMSSIKTGEFGVVLGEAFQRSPKVVQNAIKRNEVVTKPTA